MLTPNIGATNNQTVTERATRIAAELMCCKQLIFTNICVLLSRVLELLVFLGASPILLNLIVNQIYAKSKHHQAPEDSAPGGLIHQEVFWPLIYNIQVMRDMIATINAKIAHNSFA